MRGGFKHYAKEAKQRLADGFWQNVKEQRQAHLKTAADDGKSAIPTLIDYREKIRNQIYNKRYFEEEEFYLRVVDLLESEIVITNPLGALADKNFLDSLDVKQRQSYLYELSNKYLAACERYKKEKENQ
ncbi:MAG TPA: hypothetical protein P5087_04480 [Eubacteriales bacterium]|jgi:hypothetical protein|nr:hypothetical protein [Eubacteriales bacterium]